MTEKSATSWADRILDKLQDLRDEMDKGFSSLDRSLSAMEKSLDSSLKLINDTDKVRARFFDFIFNISSMLFGVMLASVLIHIH